MIIEKLLSLQKTKAAKIVLYAYKYKGTNLVREYEEDDSLGCWSNIIA